MPLLLEKFQALDKNSPFEQLAQAGIKRHYSIPYPGRPDKRPTGEVNRKHHGGVHVSNTALNIEMLIALYQKYRPELLVKPDGSPLSEEDIKLIKLAAIYHDSANTSEVSGNEMEHAMNFAIDMSALNFTATQIGPFSMAISMKDGQLGNGKKNPLVVWKELKTIYQKLLHDADCLDIIRVVGNQFQKECLAIFHDLQGCAGFLEELDAIIANHQATLAQFSGNEKGTVSKLHRDCEYAPNCYLAVKEAHKNFLLQHILLSTLEQGKHFSMKDMEKIDLSSLSILDFYNRQKSPAVQQLIHSLVSLPAQEEKEVEEDPVARLMKTTGCFVRALQSGTEEIQILQKNAEILRKYEIKNPADMKAFLENQIKEGKAQILTPDEFQWRPCSLLAENVSVQLFAGRTGVILDPKAVFSPYLYKKNAGSRKSKEGRFVYEPEKGGLKNKENLEDLFEKLQEMERRRRGIQDDPHFHYFGSEYLKWSEVLGTYQTEAIIGILVGNTEQDAKDALLLRAKLGHPFRPFYRYSYEIGMVALSIEEVIQQSHSVSLEDTVNNLNEKGIIEPKGALSISDPELKDRLFFQGQEHETLYSCVTRRISCNLNGMDSKKAEMIRYLFQQLAQFHPIDEDAIELIAGLNIQESEGIIVANIEWVANRENENENKIIKFIQENLFDKIHSYISQDLSVQDMKKKALLQTGLLDILENDIDKLPDIKCLSIDKPLSLNNPLRYQFTHPKDPAVKCLAWVKEGKPVIEFQLPEGRLLQVNTSLLPKLAKQYAKQQFCKLNDMLNRPRNQAGLETIGIKALKFIVGKQKNKSKLDIEIEVLPGRDKQSVIDALIKRLPFTNPDKIQCTDVSPNRLTLSAPDVHNADSFYKFFRDIVYKRSSWLFTKLEQDTKKIHSKMANASPESGMGISANDEEADTPVDLALAAL